MFCLLWRTEVRCGDGLEQSNKQIMRGRRGAWQHNSDWKNENTRSGKGSGVRGLGVSEINEMLEVAYKKTDLEFCNRCVEWR